eukprot:GHUV01036346.1.p2 GENE.GHUV01036346.1~~GHUV01036346.1.p2  ORF type:complete len:185 (+),score=29.36 GHUV01036346.1:235-789(+)
MLSYGPSLWHAAGSFLAPVSSQCLAGLGTTAYASGRRLSNWASVDPDSWSGSHPAVAQNLVAGRWTSSARTKTIPDPLNGEPFVQLPDTQVNEVDHFVQSLQSCPKHGLHNPFKNPERSAKQFSDAVPLVQMSWHDADIAATTAAETQHRSLVPQQQFNKNLCAFHHRIMRLMTSNLPVPPDNA